jgi:phage shock protein A
MQEDLMKLRKAIIPVIAAQKRTQQQYEKAKADVKHWQDWAALALQNNNENLAREALLQKKSSVQKASSLEALLNQQTTQISGLRRNLITFESKVTEAKANKAMLKARIREAKAQMQSTIGRLGTSSAMAAFERMEEKVLELKTRSQTAYELVGADLETQFAALESGSDVDDELAAMKAQLTGNSQSEEIISSSSDSVVDDELEALRQQIDQL